MSEQKGDRTTCAANSCENSRYLNDSENSYAILSEQVRARSHSYRTQSIRHRVAFKFSRLSFHPVTSSHHFPTRITSRMRSITNNSTIVISSISIIRVL